MFWPEGHLRWFTGRSSLLTGSLQKSGQTKCNSTFKPDSEIGELGIRPITGPLKKSWSLEAGKAAFTSDEGVFFHVIPLWYLNCRKKRGLTMEQNVITTAVHPTPRSAVPALQPWMYSWVCKEAVLNSSSWNGAVKCCHCCTWLHMRMQQQRHFATLLVPFLPRKGACDGAKFYCHPSAGAFSYASALWRGGTQWQW